MLIHRLSNLHVREHIPLEQGLRPPAISATPQNTRVREHIPLEQGLRPPIPNLLASERRSESIFH